MSNTVDNRVVEMRFDNQQFEKNADKTISTLDRLKKALKLDDSPTKGLDDLGKSARSIDLSDLAKSVDSVSDRFSNMGIVGITILQRLTNAAIDAGVSIAKSFAGGGVDEGFAKYSSKMEAVQVMAINTGRSLSEINEVLEELQWYTDQTSYKYGEMISAMAKFTGSGIELEVAEEAVQGIANWAATAGVNVNNTEAAFRVLSKTMANNYMSLQDAYSLNNLNMFTPDSRRLILEVASSVGTVRKEGDRFFAMVSTGAKKAKEVEVTAADFMQTLGKGKWANREVWEEFLHLYNATAEELDEVDKKILEAAGLAENFGERAFDAAYEAKTFADALGAVKEAISTQWATSFETIFGDYQLAADLWTALCEVVIKFTDIIGDERNAILDDWRAWGGRNETIDAFVALMNIIVSTASAIKSAFRDVFPPMTGSRLAEITQQIKIFLEEAGPTEDSILAIYAAFKGFFDIIGFGIDVIKELVYQITGLISPSESLVMMVLRFLGAMGMIISYVIRFARESGVIEIIITTIISLLYSLYDILMSVIGILAGAVGAIYNFIKAAKELPIVQKIFADIQNTFNKIKGSVPSILENIVNGFNNLIDKANNLKETGLPPFFKTLNDALSTLWGWLKKVKDKFKELVDFLAYEFKLVEKPSESIKTLVTHFDHFKQSIKDGNALNDIGSLTAALKDFFGEFTIGKGILAGAGALIIAKILGIGSAVKGIQQSSGGGIIGALIGGGKGGIVKNLALLAGLGTAAAAVYNKVNKAKQDAYQASFAQGLDEENRLWAKYVSNLTETSPAHIALDDFGDSVSKFTEITRDASGSDGPIGFFGKLGAALGNFAGTVHNALGSASEILGNFFGNLNLGKIVMISFLVTLVPIILQFGLAISALPLLIFSLAKAFWGIGAAINQWSIWGVDTFGDTLMKIGKAAIYFAAAMLMIAQIPTEQIGDVFDCVKTFLYAALAITGASVLLAFTAPMGLQGIWELGLALMAIGASAMVFVYGMKAVQELSNAEYIRGLAIMVTVFIFLAAIMGKLALIMPTLKVAKISVLSLGLGLVAIAGAIILLGKVLQPDQLKAATQSIIEVVGILALFSVTIGSLNILTIGKQILLAGVGIFAFAAALILMAEAFRQIMGLTTEIKNMKVEDFLITYGAIFASIALFLAFAATLGPASYGAGIAAAGLGVAFLLIAKALETVVSIVDQGGALKAFGALVALGGVIFLLSFTLKALGTLSKDAAIGSLALIPLFGFILGLSAISALIALIPDIAIYAKLLGAMAVMSLCVGGMIALSRLAIGVDFRAILSMVAALGVIVGGLVVLSKFTDPNTILGNAVAIASILLTLGLALGVIGRNVGAALSVGPILSMVAAIGVIALSLTALSSNLVDSNRLAGSVVAILAVLWSMAGVLALLSSPTFAGLNPVPLYALIGAIVAAGFMIAMIVAQTDTWYEAIAAGAAIGAVLISLGVAMQIMGSMVPLANIDYTALIAMILSIIVIGEELSNVAKFEWYNIAVATLGVIAVMATLVGMVYLLNTIQTILNPGTIIMLGSVVLALVGVAFSLSLIAQYDWQSIVAAAAALNVTLIITTALVAALGALGAAGIGEAGIVLLIGLAAAFVIFGAAAIEFSIAAGIVAAAIYLITHALISLGEVGPEAAENIRNTLVQIGAGIGEGVATMILTFIATLLPGVAAALGAVVGLFQEVGADIDRATALGLEENGPLVYDAASHSIQQADDGFADGAAAVQSNVSNIGSDITGAAVRSLEEGAPLIYEASHDNGENVEEGFRDGADWHSTPPWMEEFGQDIINAINAIIPGFSEACGNLGAEGGFNFGEMFKKFGFESIQEVIDAAFGAIEIVEGLKVRAKDMKAFEQGLDEDQRLYNKYMEEHPDYDWRRKAMGLDSLGSGGSGGGGGGGGSAKEEVKDLFDVMVDGKDVIEKHIELFGELHEKLGYTQPAELAQSATQKLAESIYEASIKMMDAETKAAITNEEKLEEMKKVWDQYTQDVYNAIDGQIDVWGSLTYAQATATKEWDKNFKNQEKLTNQWKRSLIMIARRVSPEFLQEIIKMGPQMTLQVLEWESLTDAGLKRVEERYLGHEQYVEEFYKEVMAIAAQSAEDGMKYNDDWAKSFGAVTEYFGDVANNAQSSSDKVVSGLKEMSKASVDYAKITDQMAAKAAKAYLEVKQQVEETLKAQIDLFTKIEETDDEDENKETMDDMIEAAKSNEKALSRYNTAIDKLLERGASEQMLSHFYEAGINELDRLETIANATESEFKELDSYFRTIDDMISRTADKVGTSAAEAAIKFSEAFGANLTSDASKQAAFKMVDDFVAAMIGQIENEDSGVTYVGKKVDEGTAEGIAEDSDVVLDVTKTMIDDTIGPGGESAKKAGYEVGEWIPESIAKAIDDGTWKVEGSVVRVIDAAKETAMDSMEAHSPSRVFMRIGSYIPAGFAQGILDGTTAVENSAEHLAQSAKEATQAVVNHISDILNGEVNVDPTIRPVLDTSGIESGIQDMNGMFGGTSFSLSRGLNVQNGGESLRDLIAQTMASMNANTPQPAYAGPPINMYVYGAEGQDEEEIANIVESRLMHRINMRGGTWR